METFEIERDNARPLRFNGELIASVTSKQPSGPASNRWQELALYRTAAGKRIAERVGRTIWQGERDRHEAAVCASEAEVVKFLGLTPLAKELYFHAKIDITERID